MENNYKALIHYASPYYDPVKAHEYYEKTKQLKGKTSSSTSTKQSAKNAAKKAASERKAAASLYVKKKINEEQKLKLRDNNDLMKQELKEYNSKMVKQINKLKSDLAALSSNGVTSDGKNATVVKAEIKKLRAENAEKIKKLKSLYSSKANKIKSEYSKKLKTESEKISNEKF